MMPPEPFGFLVIIVAGLIFWLGEKLFVWLMRHTPPQLEHGDE